MSFQSKHPSGGTATYQARNQSTSSGATLSDDTSEQIHHGHLVKLDLSNGKSLHAKLVVIVNNRQSFPVNVCGDVKLLTINSWLIIKCYIEMYL